MELTSPLPPSLPPVLPPRLPRRLEHHTQIRLSILLTYLFSKSNLFMPTWRLLRSAWALLRPCRLYLADLLGQSVAVTALLLQPLLHAAGSALLPLLQLSQMLAAQVAAVGSLLLGPPAHLLWAGGSGLARLLWAGGSGLVLGLLALFVWLAQAFAWLFSLARALLGGPVYVALTLQSWLHHGLRAGVAQLAELASLLRYAWKTAHSALAAGQQLGPAVVVGAEGAWAAGKGGYGVWHWAGVEAQFALHLLRTSVYRVAKSLQVRVRVCGRRGGGGKGGSWQASVSYVTVHLLPRALRGRGCMHCFTTSGAGAACTASLPDCPQGQGLHALLHHHDCPQGQGLHALLHHHDCCFDHHIQHLAHHTI